MYKIIKNYEISKDIYELQVEAPLVAKKALPGQFVVVMANDKSERIALTIVDTKDDLVTMIYQVVGASTYELSHTYEYLHAILGPLGNPSEIISKDVKDKKYVLVAGGIGIAPLYPQAKYLHEHGAKVDIIYGVRGKDNVIFRSKIVDVCDSLAFTSNDGTIGLAGFATDELKKRENKYDEAIVIGPMIMMKATCDLTLKMNLKTTVSLNPIMVDGTGMCGACRVNVDGEIKFACVDGPEFDGHKIDFDAAIKRLNIYKTEEGRAYLKAKEGKTHHGGCGNCGDK